MALKDGSIFMRLCPRFKINSLLANPIPNGRISIFSVESVTGRMTTLPLPFQTCLVISRSLFASQATSFMISTQLIMKDIN
jgi:hypothetical protein